MFKKSIYLLVLSAFIFSQAFSSSFESSPGCGRYGELCDAFRSLNSADEGGNPYGIRGEQRVASKSYTSNGYGTFRTNDRQEYSTSNGYGTFRTNDRQEYSSIPDLPQEGRVFLVEILHTYQPIFHKILLG